MDSRESREGDVIRRRRQCLNDSCRKRFTSYGADRRDSHTACKYGTRERFERLNLESVREAAIKHRLQIADRAEQILNDCSEREISGRELGAHVMSELKKLDL